jgi:hypothetical protein
MCWETLLVNGVATKQRACRYQGRGNDSRTTESEEMSHVGPANVLTDAANGSSYLEVMPYTFAPISGKSVKTPSTPSVRNCSNSASARPW